MTKTHTIQLRITEQEKALWKQAAGLASLSAWIRYVCTERASLYAEPTVPLSPEGLTQVTNISSNDPVPDIESVPGRDIEVPVEVNDIAVTVKREWQGPDPKPQKGKK